MGVGWHCVISNEVITDCGIYRRLSQCFAFPMLHAMRFCKMSKFRPPKNRHFCGFRTPQISPISAHVSALVFGNNGRTFFSAGTSGGNNE